ncbi:K02A2.6-like [Cordylochernes scorpioides]|uniref:RNA-directed DNA polymerase n=1 Tax=Cordylochernes scorpioides TaxID=51811 RepID=A0ABY6KPY6_9ARAC|nr:K02A2.6-like [Cordylochernes scorpioides]
MSVILNAYPTPLFEDILYCTVVKFLLTWIYPRHSTKLDFTLIAAPRNNTKGLILKVYGTIGFLSLPHGRPKDACKEAVAEDGALCSQTGGLRAGVRYSYVTSFNVLNYFPLLSLQVRFTLVDPAERYVVCSDIPVKIVGAAKSQVNLMKNPGHDIDKLKARSNNFKFPCKYNNPCKICGKSNHDTKLCKFKNAQCYICNKKGHIAPVCWNKKSAQNSGMNKPNLNKLNTIQCNTLENAPKILVNVKIEDADTIMEVDTGADVSVVSKKFFLTNLKNVTLEKYSGHLKSFSNLGNLIPVFGKCLVNVSYKNYQEKLPLIVTGQFNNQTPLLGRNWIRILKADWPNCVFDICNNINVISNLELFLEAYKRVFENKDLPIQGIKGSISLRPNAKPKFFKFRPVPFSIKEKIDKELDRLEQSQIIEKVNASDWSTPSVTVIKSNGELRLCGDFKNTLNNCIEDEKYPLPTIETMLGNLGGNKIFTKLDLSSAYHQIEMDEASKNLLVVSTHRGLYRYNRLPFGISPASAIFQRCMDSLFHDVPNTVIYLDDIFIGSKDEQEHYRILKMIFDKLKELNFTLNKEKCSFKKKRHLFSRTLSSAEAKYSQTEKEALAIVFATSKLRQYLFGRKFVLKSDHKALTTVFGNKRLLPPLIANRLHRWALELSNFDFDIRYTNKDTMLCADAFSRLPLEEINSREDNIDLVTHDISFLNVTPLDHLIIEEETNKDPVLNKLKEYLLEDPQLAKKDETMKPFLSKLENFSILQGCIFVDSRAVIPRTCQDQMLKLLHQGHIGINRMKSLARSSVWWPKMDSQIEEFVKECSPCMHHQTAPPAENTPWPRTNQPWQRVHVDHFYFRGDCYLLVVDANSNWIEVFPVRGTTSQENIKLLRECFARTFVNCLNSEFIQRTFGRNECGRRHFQVGDKVLFTRVIQNRRKWFKAQVIRRLGYNVYLVKNLKGTFKVHVNQMRTGSDTKYAEDSDWTLDNAGAGPHRLEQDPQISTSPPPRRSTRPRCPPCRARMSEPVLAHFEEHLPTQLHTDKSGYGIGSVLVHVYDGKERPKEKNWTPFWKLIHPKKKKSLKNGKKDAQAKGILTWSMTDSSVALILTCKSSKEIWKALHARYEGDKRKIIIEARNDVSRLVVKKEEKWEDYLYRAERLLEQARNLGADIEYEEFITSVITGLPHKYNLIVLQLSNQEKLTNFDLRNSLKLYHERFSNDTKEENYSAFKVYSKDKYKHYKEMKTPKTYKCFICHKPGHKAAESWQTLKTRKIQIKPFKEVKFDQSSQSLDLLHVDLIGPIQPISIGKAKYILTIVDDYSKNIFTNLLKSKSDTPDAIKNFIERIENSLERKVKSIRSDNGLEFVNSNLKSYFTTKGIEHQKTTFYSPEQNGRSERANRSLIEGTRALMIEAELCSILNNYNSL